MTNFKAIIFDLDGTAIPSEHHGMPSARLAAAIAAKSPAIHFCAATGRTWSFAKEIIRALQLTDPCIVAAGTQVVDPKTGATLWEKTIDDVDVQAVLQAANDLDNELLVNDELPRTSAPARDKRITRLVNVMNFQALKSDDFDKLVTALHNNLNVVCTKVVSHTPNCFDMHITHTEATKEHAIQEVQRMLSVTKEQTVGVGDSYNDSHLFKAVGHKVAMGNAVPELKEAADEVIGTQADDGLAEFIENMDTGPDKQ